MVSREFFPYICFIFASSILFHAGAFFLFPLGLLLVLCWFSWIILLWMYNAAPKFVLFICVRLESSGVIFVNPILTFSVVLFFMFPQFYQFRSFFRAHSSKFFSFIC